METKFINHHQDQLILFFNGWGMDDAVVNHLDIGNYDLQIFYNYDQDFCVDLKFHKTYKKIFLVAWSMGVWAASQTLENSELDIEKSIAINGTLRPVDDNYGIKRSVFKGTIERFSIRNKQKFDRRMMKSKDDFQTFQSIKSFRTFEDQLLELKNIYVLSQSVCNDFIFDKAVIGKNDLIFTEENQNAFWKNKVDIINKEWAHFPFYNFISWQDIINL